ncbi:MAG: winged helix-turn-helix domain-containing protein [Proteobacteria bacterium]|nr:winged helix-turn-helix domain-containing protein [Pseudomonadota bacterium]
MEKEHQRDGRSSNVTRLDSRRNGRSTHEENPCVDQTNQYVGRGGKRVTKTMLLDGEGRIDFDDGFRVGDFEVYPKRLALVRDDTTVRLEPKVMAVLVHLAQRAGEVVTRNEFADEVWRGRVVSDEVLSRDISILRSQLGDNAKEPDYVLTIPRVGYRLIAKVLPLHDPEPDEVPLSSNATPDAPVVTPAPAETATVADALLTTEAPAYNNTIASRGWRDRRWLWAVAAVVVIAGVLLVLPRPVPPQTLDRLKIAVLPFTSLSEAPDEEFFGDGLSEEIMHALGGVAGINVVARTSSFGFRDSSEDIRAIGRKLNAGSLLEGSVRRDGNRLRITAQLIDANTGLQAWSESYDRRMSDIFEVQNQISTAIAGRLVGTLAPDARLSAAPTGDIEAYTLFLRASHLMRQRGADKLTRAIELFQQAIARDPNFGRAYAGLAEAYTLQPSYAGSSEKAAQPLALAAAAGAESLGEGTARALGVRAYLHFRSRDWQAAKDDFDQAIASSPNDSDLLQWYSQYLASIGWIERAERAAKAAVAADPLSPVANQRAGVVSLWTNDSKAAGSHFSIASEVGIQGPGLPEAWIAFLLSEGRLEEARTSLIETQTSRGQSTEWIEPTIAAITQTGSASVALEALNKAHAAGKLGVSMYVGALFFIGDADGFYAAMKDVVASGEPFDIEILFSRAGRPLRSDARFVALMTDLGLVDFWDKAGWPDMCARDSGRVVCR